MLQISSPDFADLSFCDLPGEFKEAIDHTRFNLFTWLIASQTRSSSRSSQNDITLVEGLVTSYIEKSSCIILLTVACDSEFYVAQCFRTLLV
jgi:hypothetical protein